MNQEHPTPTAWLKRQAWLELDAFLGLRGDPDYPDYVINQMAAAAAVQNMSGDQVVSFMGAVMPEDQLRQMLATWLSSEAFPMAEDFDPFAQEEVRHAA